MIAIKIKYSHSKFFKELGGYHYCMVFSVDDFNYVLNKLILNNFNVNNISVKGLGKKDRKTVNRILEENKINIVI